MKKFILFFVFLYIGQYLLAGTYSASINYKHITNNEYEIYVDIYRDTLYTVYSQLDISIGSETDTLFKFSEEYLGEILHLKYKGIHSFNQNGVNYISIYLPNRCGGINNIPNSINTGVTIGAYININPFVGANTSPVDSVWLIDSAFVNQSYNLDLSLTDPDGDSLSYKLKPCKGSNGYAINGYTYPAQPPVFVLDSITGILTWNTPQYQGRYSVLIQIEEWRSGSLISYTEREHFIVVELGNSIDNANNRLISKVEVFPNPSSDIVNIRLKNSLDEIFSIEIFDVSGRQIFSESNINKSSTNIDVNSFEKGLYFYRIVNINNDSYSGKLIIN